MNTDNMQYSPGYVQQSYLGENDLTYNPQRPQHIPQLQRVPSQQEALQHLQHQGQNVPSQQQLADDLALDDSIPPQAQLLQQENGNMMAQDQDQVEEDEEEEDEFGAGGAFANVGQGLTGAYRNMMMQYWQETINSIEHDEHDFKNHQLPLARIKKVMKTDEEVRMISAEAPILFAKGCDIFITELTMRLWIHAEENKRRTLQRSDIAALLQKSDMFDFLIDIVPREEEKPKRHHSNSNLSMALNNLDLIDDSTNINGPNDGTSL